MRKSKKQRRERIYEMRNLRERITQNKQHTAKYTTAVTADKIKWRWWWTEKITETETTTMIIMTATTTAAMTAANWIEKFSYLNRVSKEIRIRTEIKNIYNETTCSFNTYFIKKKTDRQKTTTDEFKLQFVCNRSFVVQWIHKMYFVICTHNLFIFTQQSHLNRTACSALRTVCAVFFDLIFFFHTYWERSSFFFFFFSIDLKEITIHDVSMNLMKQQKFNDNNEADAAAAAREEV